MKILRRDSEKDNAVEGFEEKISTTPTSKESVHSIDKSIAAEANMAALMRRIEAFEVKGTPPQLDHAIRSLHRAIQTVTLQLMCWKIAHYSLIHWRAAKIN